MTRPEFSPAWFLRSPHAQTVWGRIVRPRRLVTLRRETIETPDGDELVLDHLDARPGDGRGPVHLVMMHGLEGSSQSVYMQGVLHIVRGLGFGATAMNFRSCARDPESVFRMLPNRRPRFYHSGDTADFEFVVRLLRDRMPATTLVAFGASLGGNALLKWLGENPGQDLVKAAAAVSVPFDLAAGAAHLERGPGRFYVARFLRTLKKKVLRLVEEFPHTRDLIDLEATLRSTTFRQFDDAATAPLHGFAGADDYYRKASSLNFLGRITTPTICINAQDDPFLPREALARAIAAASSAVEMITPACGGHVGFVSGHFPWRCNYWAEQLVVDWLVEKSLG